MTSGKRAYRVDFTPAAKRQLARIAEPHRTRLARAIARLADNPRPSGYRKLEYPLPLYRIRVGDYRVLYAIADAVITVTITKVEHRSSVYRDL